MDETYHVFVMADADGRIVAINSSAFLTDPAGWTEIDSGEGDRYHHAQANYLPKPIRDDNGICHYKLAEGKAEPRTAEEMAADLSAETGGQMPSTEDRLAALEQQIEMLLEGATEDE